MASDLWKGCEGTLVAGQYRLITWLGAGTRGAAFAGEFADGGRKILVKLAKSGGLPSETTLSNWAAVSKLSHPHLIPLFDSGRCEIKGAPFLYAAMEWAEDNLGSVLVNRPLAAEEVREMLEPALSAIAYLHGRGFVHAGIKPANVMASGDSLKLASDSVTRAGEATPADDVRALGRTVIEALTQRAPNEGPENLDVELPEPFAGIVQHCLAPDPQERWTVAQIASRLRGIVPAAPTESSVKPAVPQAVSAPAPAPVIQPVHSPTVAKEKSKWLYPAVGAALMTLAIIFLLWRTHEDAPKPEVPVSQSIAAQPDLADSQSAGARPPLPAVDPPPHPAAATPAKVRSNSGAEVWSVVVATYTREVDAQRRARDISSKWTEFPAKVYAPPTGKRHFLVVLGSSLSQDAASQIQQRAVAAGLPRDTYIKKYPPA